MNIEFEVACDKSISIEWLGQNVLLFASVDKATAFFDDIGVGERPCGDGGAGTIQHAESGSILYYMIFRHETPDIKVIVHECSHVVDYLFEDLGFPVGREGTEPRAYLLDWLVSQVIAFYGLQVIRVGDGADEGGHSGFSADDFAGMKNPILKAALSNDREPEAGEVLPSDMHNYLSVGDRVICVASGYRGEVIGLVEAQPRVIVLFDDDRDRMPRVQHVDVLAKV